FPCRKPIGRKQIARFGSGILNCRRRQRDCRLDLFTCAAATRDEETGGEQRGAVRGGAGVSKELGRTIPANVEEILKDGSHPKFRRRVWRKHVVEDDIRR